MSTVNESNKMGHPVAGIILGIAGITVALLTTLLFGVIGGAVAGALGIGAALLGISARNHGNRGKGAIVAGAMAIVLAFSMTFASVNTMKALKEAAMESGVAPTFARYMDNPYLGVTSVVSNAVNSGKQEEATKIINNELNALKDYMAKQDKSATEKTAEARTENTTGFKIENTTGITLSIGG